MAAFLRMTRNPRIPLTLRKKLGKLAHIPVGQNFEADIFGHAYKGMTDSHLDRKVYQYGLHEPATIRLLRNLLQYSRRETGHAVYIDIGMNTGLHMLAMAGRADHAYGFEPWEKVRLIAEANFKANNLNHFHVYPFGLSDKDAVLPFLAPEGNNLGVGSFIAAGANMALEVRAGDRFFTENNIAPSVIKIDVEGHEKNVLDGLRETIKTHRPFVVFEYGSLSRNDFRNENDLNAVFGAGYYYYGIRRSREFPFLAPFNPAGKWENILAGPVEITGKTYRTGCP